MRYWNRIVAAIAAAFILFGLAYSAHGYMKTYKANNPADAVVLVTLPNGHGSGVHIGGGLILTAAHVAEAGKPISVKTDNGVAQDAEFLWASKAYDIALIRVPHAPADKANLSCRKLAVGENISAGGSPLKMEFIWAFGRVAGGERKFGPWGSVLITDITTVMGQSGGPVFANGDVVGITVGVATASITGGFVPSSSLTGFGMIVPSSTICKLMGRVEATN